MTQPLEASPPAPRAAVILGVPFHDVTMEEAVARAAYVISRREPVYWATANLDFAYQASRDVELQRILVEADLVLCDGTPLVWASRALGAPLRERVAGSDFVPRVAREAVSRGWKIFFLGGGEESLELALENLRREHPGIQVDGYSPPFAGLLDMEHEEICRRLRAFAPDILFVAFGCPKQEKWIYMHYRALGVPLSVGVGATVDFLAGKFQRAPRWMRVTGLEWVFRLAQEPRRLFQRYVLDLIFFVVALRAQRKALRAGETHPSGKDAPVAGPTSADPAVEQKSAGAGEEFAEFREVVWRGRADAGALSEGKLPPLVPDEIRAGEVVALNLEGVTFLDSSGLGAILSGYRRLAAAGGGMVLVNPARPVRELLTAMKLDRLLVFVESAAMARRALGLDRTVRARSPGNDQLVVETAGELVSARVPEFASLVERQWAANPQARTLVVDMSRTRFMDSSGLGLLLRFHRMAAGRDGGALRLRGVGENIRNVLKVAKVESLLEMQD